MVKNKLRTSPITVLQGDIPQTLERDPCFKRGFTKDHWRGACLLVRLGHRDARLQVAPAAAEMQAGEEMKSITLDYTLSIFYFMTGM